MTGVPALLGLFMLATALFALTRRNTIHAALAFILTWFALAAFFLWLGADFVAFAQILVYVGAVSMVVLFAVLLTGRNRPDEQPVSLDAATRAAGGLSVAICLAGVLVYAIVKTPLDQTATQQAGTVREIGLSLMGGQAVALLIIGVLLTVALLGAVVLAAGDRTIGRPGRVRPAGGGGHR